MNMYKKLVFTALSTLLMCGSIKASDFTIPQDVDGRSAQSIDNVGVRMWTVGRATHTDASLLSGATVLIYGLITSTKATAIGEATDFVELRANSVKSKSTELLVPQMVVASTYSNTQYWFKTPLVVADGLNMNFSTTGVMATVFYRFANNNEVKFRIPTDARGNKANGSAFYGVNASSETGPAGVADALGSEGFDKTSAARMRSDLPCLLDGFIASTGAATSYAVVYDTASPLGTPNKAMPQLFYHTLSNEAFVETAGKTKVYYFPFPIVFENGLKAERSVATDNFRFLTRPLGRLR